jgi:hypothetical protein
VIWVLHRALVALRPLRPSVLWPTRSSSLPAPIVEALETVLAAEGTEVIKTPARSLRLPLATV